MTEEERAAANLSRIGRVLSTVGFVWLALVIVAGTGVLDGIPFLEFFAGTFFFPIALLFTSRVLRRRGRAQQQGLPPTPVNRPSSARAEPRRPAPRPATQSLEDAIGGLQVDERPSGEEPTARDRSERERDPKPRLAETEQRSQPKTSAEMVEEARRKYSPDRGSGSPDR